MSNGYEAEVLAEFRGKGHFAKYSVEEWRAGGWTTVEEHDNAEYAILRAEHLAIDGSRKHRAVKWNKRPSK